MLKIRDPNYNLIKFTGGLFLLIYIGCLWFFHGSALSLTVVSIYVLVIFLLCAIVELIILYIFWSVIMFDTESSKVIIDRYIFFYRAKRYTVLLKESRFLIKPIYEQPYPSIFDLKTAVTFFPLIAIKPEASSPCSLVISDSENEITIARSIYRKRLLKKVEKINQSINFPIPLDDLYVKAMTEQAKIWRGKNTQNIISVCVIVGVSLSFNSVFFYTNNYKMASWIIFVSGIAIIVSGLVYGYINKGIEQK